MYIVLTDLTASLGLPSFNILKDLLNFKFSDVTLEKLFDFMDKAGLTKLKNKIMAIMNKINVSGK